MRYIGIDYGTKLMGISISDETNIVASGLCVIKYSEIKEVVQKIKEIITEYKISKIVLGFPLNMDGSLSKRCEEVLAFKDLLQNEIKIQVELIDERLTSVISNNILISNNTRRNKRKKVVDKVAATIILQSFLDRINYER